MNYRALVFVLTEVSLASACATGSAQPAADNAPVSPPAAAPTSPAAAEATGSPAAPAPGPADLGAALRQQLGAANLDLAVPESPAFAALGITPQNVIRPTSPRSLATSLLNGLDERGNFQTGVALDTAPYLLLAGSDLTLGDYQRSTAVRFLSRTNLSLATTKGGTTDKDPSIKLAAGLNFTLIDKGDPRLDSRLLQEIGYVLKHQPPITPDEIELQGKDKQQFIATRVARIRAALQPYRDEAKRRNWNATSWIVGFAPTWLSKSGNSGDFRWDGAAVWTSFAYGFDGVKGLQKTSQLILHLRYRNNEQVPDPKTKGAFFSADTLLLASQFRAGGPDWHFFVTPAYLHGSDSQHSGDAFRFSGGFEQKVGGDLWISFAVGHQFGDAGDTAPGNRTFVLGSLRIGSSSKPQIQIP